MKKRVIFHQHTQFIEAVTSLLIGVRDKCLFNKGVNSEFWRRSEEQIAFIMSYNDNYKDFCRQSWKSKNNFWLVCKGHGESLGRAGGSIKRSLMESFTKCPGFLTAPQ